MSSPSAPSAPSFPRRRESSGPHEQHAAPRRHPGHQGQRRRLPRDNQQPSDEGAFGLTSPFDGRQYRRAFEAVKDVRQVRRPLCDFRAVPVFGAVRPARLRREHGDPVGPEQNVGRFTRACQWRPGAGAVIIVPCVFCARQRVGNEQHDEAAKRQSTDRRQGPRCDGRGVGS